MKNIDDKIRNINVHLENSCQQQNLDLISNNNIKKSDLNSSLHSSLNSSSHQFTQVFETGINNHHLIIYTMLKSTYAKLKPSLF